MPSPTIGSDTTSAAFALGLPCRWPPPSFWHWPPASCWPRPGKTTTRRSRPPPEGWHHLPLRW